MFLLFPLSKKLYPHCLVLVGSRNRLKRDLHKQILQTNRNLISQTYSELIYTEDYKSFFMSKFIK